MDVYADIFRRTGQWRTKLLRPQFPTYFHCFGPHRFPLFWNASDELLTIKKGSVAGFLINSRFKALMAKYMYGSFVGCSCRNWDILQALGTPVTFSLCSSAPLACSESQQPCKLTSSPLPLSVACLSKDCQRPRCHEPHGI